jgi:hypothetical protein
MRASTTFSEWQNLMDDPRKARTPTLTPPEMNAEELLAHYAAKTLTPLQALQAVTEKSPNRTTKSTPSRS